MTVTVTRLYYLAPEDAHYEHVAKEDWPWCGCQGAGKRCEGV